MFGADFFCTLSLNKSQTETGGTNDFIGFGTGIPAARYLIALDGGGPYMCYISPHPCGRRQYRKNGHRLFFVEVIHRPNEDGRWDVMTHPE